MNYVEHAGAMTASIVVEAEEERQSSLPEERAPAANQTHQLWLSVIRVFSTFCVILVHLLGSTFRDVNRPDLLAVFGWASIARQGVPLFFLQAGALLIPTDLSAPAFLWRRLSRIVPAYFTWQLINRVHEYGVESLLTFGFRDFLRLCFGQYTNEVYWFIPRIVSCYLMFPPLSVFYKNSDFGGRWYYGIVWILGAVVLPQLTGLLDMTVDFASYFYTFRWDSVGYCFLGALLRNDVPHFFRGRLGGILLALAYIVACSMGTLVPYNCMKNRGVMCDGEYTCWFAWSMTSLASAAFCLVLCQNFIGPTLLAAKQGSSGAVPSKLISLILHLDKASFTVYLAHSYAVNGWYRMQSEFFTEPSWGYVPSVVRFPFGAVCLYGSIAIPCRLVQIYLPILARFVAP